MNNRLELKCLTIVVLGLVMAAAVKWLPISTQTDYYLKLVVDTGASKNIEVAQAIKKMLEADRHFNIQLINAPSSIDARRMLISGDADLSLMTPGLLAQPENLFALFPYAQQYLHVFSKQQSLSNINQAISGSPLVNAKGSNTFVLANLLSAFGSTNLSVQSMQPITYSALTQHSQYRTALKLAPLGDRQVADFLTLNENIHLAQLTDIQRFNRITPYLQVATIPQGMYATEETPLPKLNSNTLSLATVLMSSVSIDKNLLNALEKILFSSASFSIAAKFDGAEQDSWNSMAKPANWDGKTQNKEPIRSWLSNATFILCCLFAAFEYFRVKNNIANYWRKQVFEINNLVNSQLMNRPTETRSMKLASENLSQLEWRIRELQQQAPAFAVVALGSCQQVLLQEKNRIDQQHTIRSIQLQSNTNNKLPNNEPFARMTVSNTKDKPHSPKKIKNKNTELNKNIEGNGDSNMFESSLHAPMK